MIKKLLITACLMLLPGCHNNINISVEQIKQLIESGRFREVVLLDVRTSEEYAIGHIPGSLNLPLNNVEERIGELDREKPIIVYCKSGCNRSLKAYQILKDKGFKRVKNIAGGIDEWCRIGGEIEGIGETGQTKMPVWEIGHGCED